MKKEITVGQVVRNVLKEIRDAIFDSISFDNKPEMSDDIKYGMMEKPPKRARRKDGRFRGDIVGTKEYNEAWVGGKAPKKKSSDYKKGDLYKGKK